MAFIEKLMSLPELIDSINRMPAHDDIAFFHQNIRLITRELEIEFREMRDEADEGDGDDGSQDGDWTELED